MSGDGLKNVGGTVPGGDGNDLSPLSPAFFSGPPSSVPLFQIDSINLEDMNFDPAMEEYWEASGFVDYPTSFLVLDDDSDCPPLFDDDMSDATADDDSVSFHNDAVHDDH